MIDHLIDFLKNAAEHAVSFQNIDGSMPAGQNGPHGHRMTPVRNTAHYSLVFLYGYKITQEKKYYRACRSAADYLTNSVGFTHFYNHLHREEESRDRVNGLIGAAWVGQALVNVSIGLDEPRYGHFAAQLFGNHWFDWRQGAFGGIEVDGCYLPLNGTLNQQR